MKRPATAELRLASKMYSKMAAISTFALGRNSTLGRRIALGPLRFGNERCDMRVNFLKGKVRSRIAQRRTDAGADHGKPFVSTFLAAEGVRLLLNTGELQE
jgi:hypothetical protein